MTERMHGSAQSLPSAPWTLPRWRTAATELLQAPDAPLLRRARYWMPIARRPSWRCQEALIRQDFGYRFHMAMQETCAVRRHAAIEQLEREQQASLHQAREASLADVRSDREQRQFQLAARGVCRSRRSPSRFKSRPTLIAKQTPVADHPRRPPRLARRPVAGGPKP
jgi:hypothetical protein